MESSKHIYHQLNELVQANTPVAMATVVRTRGSVPREPGAKMIIHPYGQHLGAVGGGGGEADVIKSGLNVIESGQSEIVMVDLSEDISMDAQAVCGGVMEIFVERLLVSPALSQLLAALTTIDARQPLALATIVIAKGEFSSHLSSKALLSSTELMAGAFDLGTLTTQVYADIRQTLKEGPSQMLTYAGGDLEIFVEAQVSPPQLIIVGAGHVALPLAQLGKMIDFEVAVLDDRSQYANRARFPGADKIIVGPPAERLGAWPIDNNTFVVLVTRGHSYDVECLLEIIDSPPRYIGMIGSKRRVSAVFELLEKEMGVSPEKLGRVHAPIGLDIGAETPAEIAVCIIAEIINLYRNGRAESLSDALRRDRRLPLLRK